MDCAEMKLSVKLLRIFYSPKEIANQHAAAAWERGEKWECVCPSCQEIRDLPKIPCVEPIDDHTY
jgi:hypothetical protein